MNLDKYRKYSMYIIIANLIALILFTILFWNSTVDNINQYLFWLILLFICIVASTMLLFGIIFKTTDTRIFNNIIQKKVGDERARFIAELEEKKNKVEKTDTDKEIKALVKKLIPSSNLKKLDAYSKKLLVNLAGEFELTQGIIYLRNTKGKEFNPIATYALKEDAKIKSFESGDGLNGEAVKSKEIIKINDIPDDYFEAESGLGNSKPKYILIVPIISAGRAIGTIEIGAFKEFDEDKIKTIELLINQIHDKLKTLS